MPRLVPGVKLTDDDLEPVIVAEISRNWPGSPLPTISVLFNQCILHNLERGYILRDWRFNQVVTEPGAMVETIIAVFERKEQA